MTIKFLSVSGGGWNSFSNLAGAMAGSLDRLEEHGMPRSVDALMHDYDYISGNSGGTWFLTSLGFSGAFNNSLSNRSSADNYNTKGFNGNVKKTFDGYNSYSLFKTKFDAVAGMVLVNFRGNWGNFIKDSVYKQTGDPQILSQRFSGEDVMPWAREKSITYATALTKTSILNKSGKKVGSLFMNQSPPIVRSPGIARDKVFAGYSSMSKNKIEYDISNFVPLSIQINKDGQAEYRMTGNQGLNIKYNNNSLWGPADKVRNFPKQGSAKTLAAVDPSLSSSAAIACLAIPSCQPSLGQQNEVALASGSLAPIVSFGQNGLSGINQEPKVLNSIKKNQSNIANKGYIRTADGGYLDNTSLAYNLSTAFSEGDLDVSQKGQGLMFEATLFQNNSSETKNLVSISGVNGSKAYLPSDLAALFGMDNDKRTSLSNKNQIHPDSGLWTLSPNIFTSESLIQSDLKTKWHYDQPGGDIKLQYYELKVETIQNDAFGIEAGVQGTLKIFLSLNPSSDAIPYKKDIHQDYFDNYDSWRTAISTSSDDIAFFDSRSVISASGNSSSVIGSTEDQIIVADRKKEIISGGKGSDFLIGKNSDQVLKGGSDRDLISAKGGNDLLIGGLGADKLHGGGGADVFKYNSIKHSRPRKDSFDEIMDFDVKKDRIDLSPIQKKFALNFIGSSQFENPGDIRISGRSLYLNTDSDLSPEMKIVLVGLKSGTFTEDNIII